jgi:ABC-type polysaccharide/polyol phosphate transport system ATPase subunit
VAGPQLIEVIEPPDRGNVKVKGKVGGLILKS